MAPTFASAVLLQQQRLAESRVSNPPTAHAKECLDVLAEAAASSASSSGSVLSQLHEEFANLIFAPAPHSVPLSRRVPWREVATGALTQCAEESELCDGLREYAQGEAAALEQLAVHAQRLEQESSAAVSGAHELDAALQGELERSANLEHRLDRARTKAVRRETDLSQQAARLQDELDSARRELDQLQRAQQLRAQGLVDATLQVIEAPPMRCACSHWAMRRSSTSRCRQGCASEAGKGEAPRAAPRRGARRAVHQPALAPARAARGAHVCARSRRRGEMRRRILDRELQKYDASLSEHDRQRLHDYVAMERMCGRLIEAFSPGRKRMAR